jgi:hypothetical protein
MVLVVDVPIRFIGNQRNQIPYGQPPPDWLQDQSPGGISASWRFN